MRSDPFDIDDCSRLVAVVASELYSSNPVYQPLEGLLAVSAAARLSHVDIYLQVSTHSFILILDTVADSTEGIKEEEEEEEREGEEGGGGRGGTREEEEKEEEETEEELEMWAPAQRDGRPAEYRWRPLFNAAKFG